MVINYGVGMGIEVRRLYLLFFILFLMGLVFYLRTLRLTEQAPCHLNNAPIVLFPLVIFQVRSYVFCLGL
jgi:hypothetical protein